MEALTFCTVVCFVYELIGADPSCSHPALLALFLNLQQIQFSVKITKMKTETESGNQPEPFSFQSLSQEHCIR